MTYASARRNGDVNEPRPVVQTTRVAGCSQAIVDRPEAAT
jgi:hypothetical protein